MKTKKRRDRKRGMEEFLRPNRRLGYDHDYIAVYLYNRGAYRAAEGEFRRAVWLNPFEIKFKIHLAWCLYKIGLLQEAEKYTMEVLLEKPDEGEMQRLLEHINDSSRR